MSAGPALSDLAALQQIADQVDDVIWLTDTTTHQVLYVNSAYETVWGRSAEALYADALDWVRGIHPADAPRVEQAFSQISETDRYDEEFRLIRPNGTTRWIRDRGHALRDDDGRVVRVAGIAQDITDRHRVRQMRETERRLLAMLAAGRRLEAILAALLEAVEAEGSDVLGSVLLLTADGQRLVAGAAPHLPEAYWRAIDGIDTGARAGSCAAAIHRGERVISADIQTDPLWADLRELAAANGLRACWSEPIVGTAGQPLGTLALYHRQVLAPSASDLLMLARAAQLTVLPIERRRHDEQLSELLEAGPDAMLIVNTGGVITRVNRQTERLFGYDREELLGNTVEMLVPAALSAKHRSLRDAFVRSGEQNRPMGPGRILHGRRKDGGMVPVGVNLSSIQTHEGQVVVCAARDITHRVKMTAALEQHAAEIDRYATELEQRVDDRTASLAVALERAESADKLKSAFLATMSHELRTPLNSIIGFTGVLLQRLAGPVTDEQAKQLGIVRDSANHLLHLINDVLDISKIEAEQLELRLAPFDLPVAVEKVAEVVSTMAERKGLRLSVEVEPGAGTIVSDRRRVEQVLLNLVNNAVKFTERGEVRVTCRAAVDTLEVQVFDTGPGIAAADLEHIFDPFYQVSGGLARPHDGTGLGLSISKRLIGMLGGDLSVESKPGVGSTFTVVLPERERSPR